MMDINDFNETNVKMNPLMEWGANPKTATTVAAGTTATGMGQIFQWIPSDMGRLAALAGFVLTCILIYVHIKKSAIEASEHALSERKKQLEIEMLKLQFEDLKKKQKESE